MKKILYIISTLRRCSPTNQMYSIIKYLDKNEFVPVVVTLSPEPKDSLWDEYKNLGTELHSLGLTRLQGLFKAKKKLEKLIDSINPDIIHSHGFRPDVISSKIRRNYKISTVHNFPQYDFSMTYGSLIGKIMCKKYINSLKKISLCVGVSKAATNNLKNVFNINKTVTIQNGVNTEKFISSNDIEKQKLRKELGLPLTETLIISSGNLTERKDPLFLINTWKKNKELKNYHLVFIGSGNLSEECIKAAENNKNIHIIGSVNNVADYLGASDYFISSSKAEGLPYAVLEAMACGLSVLLSDIDPHKEILEIARDSGFCYKLGSEENFMNNFKKLMEANRERMSKSAAEAIEKHFSAKKMSEKYQEIYKKF